MENKKVTVISVLVGMFTFILRFLIFDKDIFETVYWVIAMTAIVPIAWKDYREHIIPNLYLIYVLRFFIPVFLINLIVKNDYLISIVLSKFSGAVLGGGIFLISMLISPKGIGAGDVKLYGVMGFLIGIKAIFNVMLYALILGAVSSIVLLMTKKKSRKDELPLAPYTFFGLLFALCAGV